MDIDKKTEDNSKAQIIYMIRYRIATSSPTPSPLFIPPFPAASPRRGERKK